MCVDGIAIFLAALVAKWAYIVAFLQHNPEMGPYAVVGAVGAAIAVAAMHYQGLYDFEVLSEARGQTKRILLGLAVAALFLIATGYLLKISEQYSRGWFIVWFALSAFAVLAVHVINTRVLR
jgi:putative colanic acid biosynthesis UDP-glucose lipid carrier transferase